MAKVSGKAIARVEVKLSPSADEVEELLSELKDRFDANMQRHSELDWQSVFNKLLASPDKVKSLFAMEMTDGEPDVIGYEKQSDEFIFADCAEQSPIRRSICYDGEAEQQRVKKGLVPGGNAVDLAAEMGIALMDESQYFVLQQLGEFDTKTESWLKTPGDIRKLGGAIYGNRRYNRVFVGHNSAPSFYGARGFRGLLSV